MIPPTPTTLTTMPASAKAKIGFSIDSIVGSGGGGGGGGAGGNDDVTKKDTRNEFKYANDYQTEIARALRLSSDSNVTDAHIKFRPDHLNGNTAKDVRNLFDYTMKRETSLSPSIAYNAAMQTNLPSEEHVIRRSRSPSPHRTIIAPNHNNHSNNNNNNNNSANNNNNSGTNESSTGITSLPPFMNGMPNSVPIRPLPIVPPNLVETKTVPPPPPPYFGLGAAAAAAAAAAAHTNPHIIQAQIQMAAAMAQRQAAAEQTFGPGVPFRHAPPPHLSMNPGGIGREGYPLYPWLLSRHGRIFPHGFPGNFLLHPFRKPKRVRTAFSPGQLLKLEHAFESNQYVVGAERKALAQALNLSETQVKVWFQNRRTKHKRMQQEDDTKGEGAQSGNNDSHSYDDEDEMIDMEMDDCSSDDEHGLPH